MATYTFYQLDVFTDRPLAGNPLAVFPDARGLADDTMQGLAREMNLSETVFVTPSDKAKRRVRFFTPAREIPLAGHPTIGTWWLLCELGQLDTTSDGVHQFTQETGQGILPVDVETRNGRPTRVAMVQTLPEFGHVFADREALGRALGGQNGTVAAEWKTQIVSTALPQLIVPITSLAHLQALPGTGGGELASLLRHMGTDCAMCYTRETIHSEATVQCRMFAPGLGVPEDPATGSAAGALAAYLVHYGIVKPDKDVARVIIDQGIEMNRPSRIHAEIRVGADGQITEVRVGGKAVTIITGEVRL